jgi:predicted nucleotidyltransferase
MKEIEIIKESLIKIYDRHKDNGLLSIYLFGSTATGEYNPEKSDVDVIGIINANYKIDDESIRAELKVLAPTILDFGFRYITTDELKLGKPNGKNILTNIIHPRMLLHEMDNWDYVIGENYKIKDFTDEPPFPNELIEHQMDKIKRDNWLNCENVDKDFIVYYLKGVTRLIFFSQLNRGIRDLFSYGNLEKNADHKELKIIKVFKELKEKKYPKEILLKYRKELNDFVESFLL